jgi:hypothetical protein
MALVRANAPQESLSVKAGHVQIQEDETWTRAGAKTLQSMDPIDGDDHRTPEALDEVAKCFADVRVIVDDENVTHARH